MLYAASSLAAVVGDTVAALKICSVLFDTILTCGIFALIFTLTLSEWTALAAVAILPFLPSHLYFVGDFTKNLACLAFLIWAAVLLIRSMKYRNRVTLTIAGLFAIAASLSHKSAIPLIGIAFLLSMVSALALRRLWIISSAITCLWFLPAFVRFRTGTLMDSVFFHSVPTVSWWAPERLALLLVSWVLLARLILVRDVVGKLTAIVLGAAGLFAILITVNPLLNQNSDLLGGRISFTTFLQLALLIPGLLLSMYRARDFSCEAVVIPCLSFLIVLSTLGPPSALGIRDFYLARRAEMVSNLTSLIGRLDPQRTLVIAPHGDEFLITAVLHVPAQQHWRWFPSETLYWVLDRN